MNAKKLIERVVRGEDPSKMLTEIGGDFVDNVTAIADAFKCHAERIPHQHLVRVSSGNPHKLNNCRNAVDAAGFKTGHELTSRAGYKPNYSFDVTEK